MANKNIEDFFGEKKRDKSKCKNILDLDFVEETASDSPTEKLSDDEKFENNKITNTSSNKKSNQKIRKYENTYIKYGFSCMAQNGTEKPICVLCGETLANSSMVPSKLQRHLEKNHKEYKSKDEGFFRAKLNSLNTQKLLLSESFGVEGKSGATEASFRVSHIIGKQGKPHTIAESLVLPCAKIMVECLFGEKESKKLDKIPLSNDTVTRRIDDIAQQVKQSLIEIIKKSRFFALQLDESTDLTNLAELMTYIRFEDGDKVKEEFLFCEPLKTNTTADAIFEKVIFFK